MNSSESNMSGPGSHEETLFDAARKLTDPAQRLAFLDAACANDPELRRRIEDLLAAQAEADKLFEEGAPGFGVPPSGGATHEPAKAGTPSPLTEKPGDRIGRYKLLQQIGEGGCGIVYMAEQEEPVRRRVALKVIKLGMDTKNVIARFEAERQALALMDHPNIAKIFDAGVTGTSNDELRMTNEFDIRHSAFGIRTGRPYFVMELVRGVKLTDYCDQHNLSIAQRLGLFTQVCHALQHAHQKGIIHRDIKPSNVLVTLHDGVPVPKVIDFGIAKATSDQRLTDKTLFTAFEQFIGTPAYMSPEQAELSGLDIDTRSDIYSLGVLLYELLTGKTPFDAKELLAAGLDEMRRTIREVEPVKPSTRLTQEWLARSRGSGKSAIRNPKSEIDKDLDWIVMKALEKDRSRRYETANGLATDIQRHLSHEPVLARPPSRLYQFQKLVRRNKLAFAAAAAVLLALVAGLALSTWALVRERAARQQARTEAARSKQVARFLKEMLKGVEPSVALGRDTTMLREILDKTAERVGKDLKNQPAVEAELQNTLGDVYHELGEYAKSAAMHREALALQRKVSGDEHPEVVRALNGIGVALHNLGKHREAEALLREALALCKRLFGQEHPSVAQILNNLGGTLAEQRKYPEAEALYREALAMQKKLLGPEQRDLARLLNNLAHALNSQRKYPEAMALYREALAMQKKLLGPEHPDVAILLNNLANAMHGEGKYAHAEPLYREALAMQKKLVGPDHPAVAFTLNNLANALHAQGKSGEVESIHRERLALVRQSPTNDPPRLERHLYDLAEALYRQNKLAEAEPLYRELLQSRRARLAADSGDVISATFALGRLLSDWARTDTADGDQTATRAREGEQLFRDYLTAVRKRYAERPATLEDRFNELAEFHFRQGQYAEAEPLYCELLQSRRARLNAEHENVVLVLGSLGRLLAEWAWTERTNSVAADVRRLTSASPNDQSLVTSAATSPLGRAGEANSVAADVRRLTSASPNDQSLVTSAATSPLDRAREAERLLRETLAIRTRGTNASHWRTADVQNRLGCALVALAATDSSLTTAARDSKLAEAETLLLVSNEHLQQSKSADRKYKRDALERLVRLYEVWPKPDQAAQWKQTLADFEKPASSGNPLPPAESPP